jgi:hypothetical protein
MMIDVPPRAMLAFAAVAENTLITIGVTAMMPR